MAITKKIILVQRLREVCFFLLITLASFLLLAMLTYTASDPGWTSTGSGSTVTNLFGPRGAWLADFSMHFLGIAAYLLPGYCLFLACRTLFTNTSMPAPEYILLRLLGFLCVIASTCCLASLHLGSIAGYFPASSGGILGLSLAHYLALHLNSSGTSLLATASLGLGLTLLMGLGWLMVFKWLAMGISLIGKAISYAGIQAATLSWRYSKIAAVRSARWLWQGMQRSVAALLRMRQAAPNHLMTNVSQELQAEFANEFAAERPIFTESTISKQQASLEKKLAESKQTLKTMLQPISTAQNKIAKLLKPTATPALPNNSLPPVDLLDETPASTGLAFSKTALDAMVQEVESKLRDFGIETKVVGVYPGPVVTRLELNLAPGVKASRITVLSRDLARSLLVAAVRVVEVIPGKAVVGLEIPNQKRELVTLRDMISAASYQDAPAPLTLALGKDIAGIPVIVNLAKMPHLLIAGTTGAGKSVGINAILLSILFKASLEQVRLILIDPKMLELSVYAGIPHLLTPVVTDVKDATNVLRWCVGEMERRYQLMAAIGVRNIDGFNEKVRQAVAKGAPLLTPLPLRAGEEEELTTLPYIVVIIDEFADMVMVVGKKIEELIARIAQKARASGIHMILATQRPSVDVITGLIKANIPTRISFQVSSKIDSRTILDRSGAEDLLGNGDMLYLPAGSGMPTRVHGAYVSDREVHAVVEYLRTQYPTPNYVAEISQATLHMQSSTYGHSYEDDDDAVDVLYEDAVQLVREQRRVSISSIQRYFKIGYNRAARIVEHMECMGVVSAVLPNGLRELRSAGEPRD